MPGFAQVLLTEKIIVQGSNDARQGRTPQRLYTISAVNSIRAAARRAVAEGLENRTLLAADPLGRPEGYAAPSGLLTVEAPLYLAALATNPSVTRTRPADGATNVSRDTFISADVVLPNAAVDATTLSSATVKLYRTSDNQPVDATINTSGGGDTIVLTPKLVLQANTKYTFAVTAGVKDETGATFVPYTATFTTGTDGASVDSSIQFQQVPLDNTTGHQYTCVVVAPDKQSLWAGTSDGKIIKFAINADGTLGSPKVYTSLTD